jgi:hypothetical protein
MKTIKLVPLLTAGLLIVLMASCGPSYVSTGVGYAPRPYYGYGYNSYGYARPYGYYRPPVIVTRPNVIVRPRYNAAPRYYNSPNARSGFGGNSGGYRGGSRGRGPR